MSGDLEIRFTVVSNGTRPKLIGNQRTRLLSGHELK